MEIKNTRRILCLGAPNSGVLTLLKDLTGSAPTPLTISRPCDSPSEVASGQQHDTTVLTTTTAGLSHEVQIRTKYYNADVPIWMDEVISPTTWKADFLSDEASEVVKAVGAWIVVFRRDSAGSTDTTAGPIALLAAVSEVIRHVHGDEGLWDGVCLAVGMPPSSVGTKRGNIAEHERTLDEWEDLCTDHGFEYIAGDERTQGRNADGDLRGIARLKEALEANDWNGAGDEDDVDDEFGFDDFENGHEVDHDKEDAGFGLEKHELEREFTNLIAKADNAEDEDEAFQVEELERMMLRMQATRDMSAHLPLQERRRVAARAINDLLNNG